MPSFTKQDFNNFLQMMAVMEINIDQLEVSVEINAGIMEIIWSSQRENRLKTPPAVLNNKTSEPQLSNGAEKKRCWFSWQ